MHDALPDRLTSDARALAEQFGTQTTEALIRAVSGVQEASGESIASATASAQSVSERAGRAVAEQAPDIALPNTSTRVAWRAGRFVGRIEGAFRLARFGGRVWWRQRQRAHRRNQDQGPVTAERLRVLLQWGPTTVASVWMAAQVVGRLRRRGDDVRL